MDLCRKVRWNSIGEFPLDFRHNINHFSDTQFNNNVLIPLGKELENILGEHLQSFTIDNNGKKYDCKISLLSKEELMNFSYYKIYRKYFIYTEKSRADSWLRSVASSSNFCHSGSYGRSIHWFASYRSDCRPLLIIG